MKLKRTIKGRELYRIIFFGVIFSVAAIGALAYWGVREIRRDAAVVAVESSARGLSGAVTVLLNTVRGSYDDFSDGVLDSLEPQALHKELSRVFERHAMVSAVLIGDDQGLVYLLTRQDGGFVEAVPLRDGSGKIDWARYSKKGKRDGSYDGWDVDLKVVDRALVGEIGHLEPGQVNWRSSNQFHNTNESWITASTLEKGGGRRLMLSFIFPVDAMVSQLGGAEKGGAEKIFLYWDNGAALPVAGMADRQVADDMASVALTSLDIDDPVISRAVALLAERNTPGAPFSYVAESETWWAYAQPLTVFGDTMSLGVAVPRRNIVSTLTSDSFLQGGAAVLIVVAFCALIVLRRNQARIEAMGLRREAARSEADILELIASGEGGRLEFKQTLRFNLKSGKNGKEIEHANLKTVAAYLNSEGGTLLVGVADDGTVAGFEEDKFTNGDHALLHLTNLVSEHIGTEFTRYIDSRVIPVQGKMVMRVHCVPSPNPAFLNTGKSEEFYIRSGPASRSLSLSQFHEWLKTH